MKKFFSLFVVVLVALVMIVPAFAATEFTDGHEAQENLNRGSQEFSRGATSVPQYMGQEASKGTNVQEHLLGTTAGGVIGVRKGIHRIGAGAIDILTFWIPKKTPLIDPNEASLS
jgi:hypothetical protein